MAGADIPWQAREFSWHVIASGQDGPGPRSRHGLVHDDLSRRTILFGGILWEGNGRMLRDTWELSKGHWSKVDTSVSPPARHRGAMVYDSAGRFSVLFGGQDRQCRMLNDTWIYQEGSWRKGDSWFGRRPSKRCGHAMTFAEDMGVTVLFGGINPRDEALGDTWLFDGQRWKRLRGSGPPPRRYAAFAYHPGLKGSVLHGGAHDDHGRIQYGDTWLFRDGVWSQLPDAFTTSVRDDHALAFHHAASTFLMLGGLRHSGLLAMTNSGWMKMNVAPLPAIRQCAPVAYDPILGGLVMYGGEVGHGGSQFDETLVLRLGDTWR
jgi:hypothetical protein